MPASSEPPASPVRPARSWHPWLVASVVVAVVILIGAIAAKPPGELTIETGPVGGSYYQDAQGYQKVLAQQGINLQLRPQPNSLDIVRDVADPQSGVDVGFIAQDVSSSHDAALYTLGQIELQPLFVFANAGLGRRSVLDDLRGRRIVMPPSDSATSDAAVRVFQLYDITKENSQFSFMPLADAVKELRAGRADAGAFMLAPENAVVRDLMADSGLHLVPISEAKAIANHLPFLRPVLLPRGIYNIADAIPPNNTPMIAAPVGLVVRHDLHPYLIYALLDAVTKVHRGPTFISSAGEFPSIGGSQLSVHPLATQYYRAGVPWIYRELSPWPASILDRYQLVVFSLLLLCALYICTRYLAAIVHCAWTWSAPWVAQRARAASGRDAREIPPVDPDGRAG